MFNKKDEQRFVIFNSESTGFMTSCSILVDTVTGVNYLVAQHGDGTGVTPLLNADGTVVVSSRDELNELKYK